MPAVASNLAPQIDLQAPILEARDLTVRFAGREGPVDAVYRASIALHPGEVLGIVGESGSGKSTLAQALMGHRPPGSTIASGQVVFQGRSLLDAPKSWLQGIWGSKVAMVHQNALSTLTPTMSVGDQIAETIRAHRSVPWRTARAEAIAALRSVNILDPASLYGRYPHQLSGGQRQRVSIAIALCLRPEVLILDEPTTALDVTTEAVVLDLLRELRAQTGTTMVYISHNLAVVGQIADRIAVMYAGQLVETGAASSLLRLPRHPYTRALIDCLPSKTADKREQRLSTIPGALPSRRDEAGCIFRARCSRRTEACDASPSWTEIAPSAFVRCFNPIDPGEGEQRRSEPGTLQQPGADIALTAEGVSKSFPSSTGGILRRGSAHIAVDTADLALKRLEIVGLVGESGSGKTTMLRGIAGLSPFNSGNVRRLGGGMPAAVSSRSGDDRKAVQMVFQDPASTLNPMLSIGENMIRHIRTLTGTGKSEAMETARRYLQKVRLGSAYFDRYPRELSGGEKQRVAIARAFASGPSIVLCDEPFSALDVSVQANIVQLLLDLQSDRAASYIIVSHDLSVIRYVADRIVVMYLGTVVEEGTRSSFDGLPLHPYTEALMASIPDIDHSDRPPVRIHGQPVADDKSRRGCVFASRCPRAIADLCDRAPPPWHQVDDRRYRCHHSPGELRRIQQIGNAEPAQ
jgi:peptide/nickel transport system ATP-binding protein